MALQEKKALLHEMHREGPGAPPGNAANPPGKPGAPDRPARLERIAARAALVALYGLSVVGLGAILVTVRMEYLAGYRFAPALRPHAYISDAVRTGVQAALKGLL